MYDKASVPGGMLCHQSRLLACFSPSSVAAWLSLHFDNAGEWCRVTALAPHPQPDQNWQLASVGWSPPSRDVSEDAQPEKKKEGRGQEEKSLHLIMPPASIDCKLNWCVKFNLRRSARFSLWYLINSDFLCYPLSDLFAGRTKRPFSRVEVIMVCLCCLWTIQ